MSKQCHIRHASLACEGWEVHPYSSSSAQTYLHLAQCLLTVDSHRVVFYPLGEHGHVRQVDSNYCYLFKEDVSWFILERYFRCACNVSHNSNW